MGTRLEVAGLIVVSLCAMGCGDREVTAELAAMREQAQVEERNRAIVSRWFGTVNRENFHQMLAEFFAADCVQRMPPDAEPMIPEQFERMVGEFYAAFPEVTHTVEDLVAEGDRVAATVSVRAVHAGEFLGVPATGRDPGTMGDPRSRGRDGAARARVPAERIDGTRGQATNRGLATQSSDRTS